MCGSKISTNCGGKSIFSTCVKYEGFISESGDLESCDCHSVHDVLQDLNKLADKIYDQAFLENLTQGCFDIELVDGRVPNASAIQALMTKVCELEAAITPASTTPCSDCNDPCSENKNCCDVLYGFKYGEGELQVTSTSYPAWQAPYTGLEYTATEAGVYKVTMDVGCIDEDPNSKCFIGVGVGNNPPIVTPFTQYILSPSFTSKTAHFIIESVKVGDVLRPQIKGNEGNVGVDGVKVIYEKVK